MLQTRRRKVIFLVGLAAVAGVGWTMLRPSAGGAGDFAAAQATYVGRQSCATCHDREHKLWLESHHDLAMQEATEDTVLGEFDGATFDHYGTVSRFFKKDGRFFVHTDGPDGQMRDYRISYVFGVDPLQQYLIEFPDGRYQCLGIAWDSRPKDRGGQRWFHVYQNEGEKIGHDDPVHWTKAAQNWNFMCAECHSTNLKKNYNPKGDTYRTSWSEMDVSCEACHGPGSSHVKWAESSALKRWWSGDQAKGLAVRLKHDRDHLPPEQRDPKFTAQAEACARCHARRHVITGDYRHGDPLLDHHVPHLLTEGVYFPDGQIQDEVYVYGSFIQSKMYHKGVRCTDCHEPHSLKLLVPGNALCIRCHQHPADKFDTPAHHFHAPGTPGAACVNCHMPERTYMVVDPRRDHSLRVPRPDLSVKLGVPNACNQCHQDKEPQWAADWVVRWHGPERKDDPHYGELLAAARGGDVKAESGLLHLVGNPQVPSLARATAVSHLGQYAGRQALTAIAGALQDEDPLVRQVAIRGLDNLPPRSRVAALSSLLGDPVRAVRIEAARALSAVPPDLRAAHRDAFDAALEEFEDAQLANADRPGAHLNLGVVYGNLGRPRLAEDAYRTAIRLDPRFIPARINLADLYGKLDRNDEAEPLLRGVLKQRPDYAPAYHALGLLEIRRKRYDQALVLLGKAAGLDPSDASIHYVYGVALNTMGKPEQSIQVLEKIQRRHPRHREILVALATILRDQNEPASALKYAQQLLQLDPSDPGARQLVEQLHRGLQGGSSR